MSTILCLLAVLTAGDEWQYHKEFGYVNVRSLERKTPEQFYQHGLTLARQGETSQATSVFYLLARYGPDPEIMERALYKRAEAYWSGALYERAHHAYAGFVVRYPDAKRSTDAKKQAMWCALRVAEIGEMKTLLGLLPIGRSSKKGVELLSRARFHRQSLRINHSRLRCIRMGASWRSRI